MCCCCFSSLTTLSAALCCAPLPHLAYRIHTLHWKRTGSYNGCWHSVSQYEVVTWDKLASASKECVQASGVVTLYNQRYTRWQVSSQTYVLVSWVQLGTTSMCDIGYGYGYQKATPTTSQRAPTKRERKLNERWRPAALHQRCCYTQPLTLTYRQARSASFLANL
jgi:hypothetical protein